MTRTNEERTERLAGELKTTVGALRRWEAEAREAARKSVAELSDGIGPPKWALTTLAHLVASSHLEDFAGEENTHLRASDLRAGLPFLVEYCLKEIDAEVERMGTRIKEAYPMPEELAAFPAPSGDGE